MPAGDSQPSYLLVDGHSIIHAWPDLRALHVTGRLRHLAREQLLNRMRLYQDWSGNQVVVVFDGPSEQITDEREEGGLQIFYSGRGKSADDIIERLVSKYASQLSMQVATADQAERMCIESFGAYWLSPDNLLKSVEQAESRVSKELVKLRAQSNQSLRHENRSAFQHLS